MQDLSPEDRRRIHALMQSDPVLLERVMVAVSEHDLTMRIASAVTAQNALSVIAEKANEILARFAAVEERRAAWWEQVSGPKGAVALAIGSATTIATAWIASGGPLHP
jgi:hypothetical protein